MAASLPNPAIGPARNHERSRVPQDDPLEGAPRKHQIGPPLGDQFIPMPNGAD